MPLMAANVRRRFGMPCAVLLCAALDGRVRSLRFRTAPGKRPARGGALLALWLTVARGASAQARAALTRCREAASMLPELIEETGGD